mmetsp:Transcript_35768/g.57078  ORF Transcript_35768/g.57078 Transcript_35768/m.57078 type:complete len:247 (-) Transcript_35768:84-824(-)
MATDNGIELIHCRLVSVDCPLEENVLAEKEKRAEHGKRSIWRKFRSFGRSRGMSRSSSANSLFASDLSTSVASSMVSLSSSIPEYCSGSSQNDEDLDDEPETSEVQTTCMLRNLPSRYTREMFVRTLDLHGFKGKYNLVYLPKDFQTGSNLGHAMVNLISGAQARRFRDQFDGFRDWVLSEQKVCEVSFCPTLQGLQAHIDRYKNSPVMHDSVPDDFKPILLVKGCRVAFPPPTRRIRAPRQCACC